MASNPTWTKSYYGYAGGNPVSKVDPSGLDEATWNDDLGVYLDGNGNYWDDTANSWLPLEGDATGPDTPQEAPAPEPRLTFAGLNDPVSSNMHPGAPAAGNSSYDAASENYARGAAIACGQGAVAGAVVGGAAGAGVGTAVPVAGTIVGALDGAVNGAVEGCTAGLFMYGAATFYDTFFGDD